MGRLTSFLIRALNKNFRPPGQTCSAFFPPDEFNADEAARLAEFCDHIAVAGYEFVYEQRTEKQLQDTLDLAAEYGCFVDAAAGPWYLGVFIVAEIVMEPYATDSFGPEMYRSNVFREAPTSVQELAAFLMLMAIVCDREDTSAKRLASVLEGAKRANCPLQQLLLDEVLIMARCEPQASS